jgi:hypothetical protein
VDIFYGVLVVLGALGISLLLLVCVCAAAILISKEL